MLRNPDGQLAAVAPRVLDLEQAATYMGASQEIIQDLTEANLISSIQVIEGGPQRWLRDDLDSYLESRRISSQVLHLPSKPLMKKAPKKIELTTSAIQNQSDNSLAIAMKSIVVTEYKTNSAVMDVYEDNQGKPQKIMKHRNGCKRPMSKYFIELLREGYEHSVCSKCGNKRSFSREGKICAKIVVSDFNSTCGGIYQLEHPKRKSSNSSFIGSFNRVRTDVTEIFMARRLLPMPDLHTSITPSANKILDLAQAKRETGKRLFVSKYVQAAGGA